MVGETGLANVAFPETARLRIAQLTFADAERLQLLTNDPAITGSIHFLPTPFNVSDALHLIERSGEREIFLGIVERRSAGFAGVLGVHLQDNDQIEIGYWIGRSYQGHGYAAEAAAAIIPTLLSLFPGRRIIAECRRENSASWKTLEKLGFRSTGEAGRRPGRDLLAL